VASRRAHVRFCPLLAWAVTTTSKIGAAGVSDARSGFRAHTASVFREGTDAVGLARMRVVQCLPLQISNNQAFARSGAPPASPLVAFPTSAGSRFDFVRAICYTVVTLMSGAVTAPQPMEGGRGRETGPLQPNGSLVIDYQAIGPDGPDAGAGSHTRAAPRSAVWPGSRLRCRRRTGEAPTML
jgi:hypothetical protein